MTNAPCNGYEFQGKYPEEEFQFYFRQHWLRLFAPILRMFVFTLCIVSAAFIVLQSTVASDAGSRHVILLLLTFFMLVVQFEFMERFYNHFLYLIIVTDRRVHRIKKTLFITDDQQSVDLWVIQDINKSQHGIIQNALGFGSMYIEAQDTALKVHFVPNVGEKYEKLMHLRERARRQVQQHPNTGTLPPESRP